MEVDGVALRGGCNICGFHTNDVQNRNTDESFQRLIQPFGARKSEHEGVLIHDSQILVTDHVILPIRQRDTQRREWPLMYQSYEFFRVHRLHDLTVVGFAQSFNY